ncbi:MAG: permease [Phycisphaera sp.]|nr:permease [Phycisphaera sp.]
MSTVAISILAAFIATIVVQAALPRCRLLTVLAGATTCALLAVAGGYSDMGDLWRNVPWNVIVILVCLKLFTDHVLQTNALGRSAVRACEMSRGSEAGLLIVFPMLMFALSGVVNNLAAMLVLLPVLLAIMKVLGPDQGYVSLLLSMLLVACNLGGAASPIGDFPAVLLLGQGKMSFNDYLMHAGIPAVLIAVLVQTAFVAVHWGRRRAAPDTLGRRFAVATIQRLYRRTRVRWGMLTPAGAVFLGMIIAWSCNVSPDLVALVGVAVLLAPTGKRGDDLIRQGIDVEPVVFLLGLFVMIAAVDAAGVLDAMAAPIFELDASPWLISCIFFVAVGVLTAIFSAGPSMAAFLPLAERMTVHLPAETVYVGLALSVCAGSSFFLTAATSGVLTQSHVDAARIATADGSHARFGFGQFLPYGAMSFVLIQSGAIAYVLLFS